MASLTAFPWRTMAPSVRQFMSERLHDTLPLLHQRVPVLAAVSIGVGGFCLPWVLWWLTSPLRVSAPPTAPTGIELHQMLGALQTVLADPTLGSLGPGTPAPFTLTDVDVAVHFVVQHRVSPTGTPLYRLVPVDTALQTRPEHVQILTMRLTPTASRPTPVGAPGVSPAVPQAAEEGGLPKASPPKKRARP